MTLKCTENRALGYELRIYEFVRCDLEQQVYIAVDPMKSQTVHWASSSLKALD